MRKNTRIVSRYPTGSHRQGRGTLNSAGTLESKPRTVKLGKEEATRASKRTAAWVNIIVTQKTGGKTARAPVHASERPTPQSQVRTNDRLRRKAKSSRKRSRGWWPRR